LFVKGHDFSRAASATKQMMGFSPCGLLSCGSSEKKTFSAACLAIPHSMDCPRNPAMQLNSAAKMALF
jgi:hypothetical protein